jgi:hypothetical protein
MATRSARAETILVVVGATLILLTSIIVVSARGILNPDQFGRRLAASLGDHRVAAYVADQVTNGIVAARPNLIGVKPILESSVSAVVASDAFRAVVRSSARTAHRTLFESAGQRVVLALPDVSALVRGVLSQASPQLAEKIPPGVETTLGSPSLQRAFTTFIDVWRLGKRIVRLCWALWYVGIVMILGGLWLAPDRRRGLVFAGSALAAVGIGLLVVPPAGRILAYAVADGPALRGAITGVWLAYFANIRWLALIYGSVGLVLASAGTTVLEAVDPLARGRRMWDRVTATSAPALVQVLRGVLSLGVGACAIVYPVSTLSTLGVVVGIALVYVGLREVFRVILARVPGAVQAEATGHGGRLWLVVGGATAIVLVVLGGAAALALRGDEEAVQAVGAVTTCNGSVKLCDEAVEDVVFPGAHNAMSNADVPSWLFPHHGHGIRQMLDDGIRMLAIDVHYGVPTAGRVRTDMERESTSVDKIEGALGPEATQSAIRVRNTLVGEPEGPSQMYFCHGFCELGAYPIGPTLESIRDFLQVNPGEVVMLVVEDYVQPLELAQAFEAAGLLDYVYTGPTRTPWPTLRELIDANQRLIVFIESGKPGVGWLRPTTGVFQETPYTFHRIEDFSCRPNRGGTEGSLFMINHWIETTPAPRPSNAEIVNAFDFLLRRARQCQRERHHIPNVIMVDFYNVGDVIRVAATLNGVDSTAAPAVAAGTH